MGTHNRSRSYNKSMNIARIKALALVSLFSIMAAGCSTVATPIGEAKEAPASSFLIAPKAAAPELATVIFVRDMGQIGAHYDNFAHIDGEKAVALSRGEKATFHLEPGEHIFGASRTDLGTPSVFSIDQTLKAGRTYHYRLMTDWGSFMTMLQRFVPEGQQR